MTTVKIIDELVAWAQENICSKVKLKLPDDDTPGERHSGEYVIPTAFPMFVPANDRLPPTVRAPIPSLCVQIKEGKDDLIDKKRTVKVRFSLATWNPGEHGFDTLLPYSSGVAETSYRHYEDPEMQSGYRRNMDGWHDLWNFADLAVSKLESTEFIGGLRLVKESEGVTYGPYTEDGTIWDYYPYWFLWIDFSLECGIVSEIPQIYKNLL